MIARAARAAGAHYAPSLVALASFLALLGLTVGGWAPLDRLDTAVSEAFRAYGEGRPDLVAALRLATDAAATLPFMIAGLGAAVILAARRERRAAIACAAVTVLVPTLWTLMHWLIRRPRPGDAFVVIGSNGFPSGHTANAATAGLLAVLLLRPRLGRTGRIGTVALAAAFAIFIGVTRMALLAHWPADVLGGWLLAVAVVPPVVRLSAAAPAGRRVQAAPGGSGPADLD